jgi:hypothetical protein
MIRSLSAFVAATMLLAAPAAAVTRVDTPATIGFDQLGTRLTINYNGFSDELLRPYLRATQIISLASVSTDQKAWTFNIVEYKNTTIAPATKTRLNAFGFDIANATLASATISNAGPFANAITGKAAFPQFGNVQVCFSAGDKNCQGGGNAGLDIGSAITTGSFVLNLKSGVDKITLDNFTVRYTAIEGEGFKNDQGSGSGIANSIYLEPLPEPATWVQLIVGFGFVGAIRRNLRRTRPGSVAA